MKMKMRCRSNAGEKKRKYVPPKIITYSKDEILKKMGPVGGCISPDYSEWV